MRHKYYYHFTGDTLRDGRPLPNKGVWIHQKGKIVPCSNGLHASAHPFDALSYSSSNTLHLVRIKGLIVPHGDPVDKVAAQSRMIVKTINAELVMRSFARRCAMDVLSLWKHPPAIVVKYLKTGDESIRAAARDAAQDAAWAADRYAARDAAWAAAWAAAQDAAQDAARDAAQDAAWAAARYAAQDAARYAARYAAWDAAWAAAQDAACAAKIRKYRLWFKQMVDAEFRKVK